MGIEIETREQWVRACASRLQRLGTLDADSAAALAEDCARLEQEAEGSDDPQAWCSPETAADAELRSW